MKQKTRKLPGKLPVKTLTVAGIILLVCVVVFLARGWVRVTAAPKTVAVLYGHSLQRTFDSNNRLLDNPLTLLGYTSIDKHSVACRLDTAIKLKTAIDCDATYHAYEPVAADKVKLKANAAHLSTLLKAQGWSGNPSMSLNDFIAGISAGKDYLPDATYIKSFGATTCTLSTTVAFSHPATPKMNTYFTCNRVLHIFGDPFPESVQSR